MKEIKFEDAVLTDMKIYSSIARRIRGGTHLRTYVAKYELSGGIIITICANRILDNRAKIIVPSVELTNKIQETTSVKDLILNTAETFISPDLTHNFLPYKFNSTLFVFITIYDEEYPTFVLNQIVFPLINTSNSELTYPNKNLVEWKIPFTEDIEVISDRRGIMDVIEALFEKLLNNEFI